MLVFATFGVQLFAGKLARCNDPTVSSKVIVNYCTFLSCYRALCTVLKRCALWAFSGGLPRHLQNQREHLKEPQFEAQARGEETRILGAKSLVRNKNDSLLLLLIHWVSLPHSG